MSDIDCAVRSVMDEACQVATDIRTTNREVLHSRARTLLETESMHSNELVALLVVGHQVSVDSDETAVSMRTNAATAPD